MSRPTDGLRAEIAQSVREMPDDVLLALVAHHVQPKRVRRPKVEPDVGLELAGLRALVEGLIAQASVPVVRSEAELSALLGELRGDRTRAEADAAHYKASLNEAVSTGFQDRARAIAAEKALAGETFRADAAEEQVVKWKAQADDLTSRGLELLTQLETAEQRARASFEDALESRRDLAAEKMVRASARHAVAAIEADVARLRTALVESGGTIEKLRSALARAGLAAGSASPFARAWKSLAREMKDRWQASLRREKAAKPVPRLMVPTDPEACERAKLASGVYEREPIDSEAEEQADLGEDPPTSALSPTASPRSTTSPVAVYGE